MAIDQGPQKEAEILAGLVDDNPCQMMHALYVRYLCACQGGREEEVRMLKCFILAWPRM